MYYLIRVGQIKLLEKIGFSVIIFNNKLIIEYEIPNHIQQDDEKHIEEQFAKMYAIVGIADDVPVWESGQVGIYVWVSCDVEVEYEHGEFVVVINSNKRSVQ